MASISFRDSGIKAWAPSLASVCFLDLYGITACQKFDRLLSNQSASGGQTSREQVFLPLFRNLRGRKKLINLSKVTKIFSGQGSEINSFFWHAYANNQICCLSATLVSFDLQLVRFSPICLNTQSHSEVFPIKEVSSNFKTIISSSHFAIPGNLSEEKLLASYCQCHWAKMYQNHILS